MKRCVAIVCLVLSVVMLMAGAAMAGPTGSFTALPIAKPLSIDGSFDDWNLTDYSTPTFILDPSVSFVRGPQIQAKDHSAKVYLGYDDVYLYVAADVADINIQGSGIGSGIWNNTGIELWLNGGNINIPSAVAGAESYETTDFQIDLAVMSGGKETPTAWCFSHGIGDSGDVKLATVRTATGYRLEAAIPKAKFAGLSAFKKDGEYAVAISSVSYAGGVWGGLFSPGPKWEYAKLAIK